MTENKEPTFEEYLETIRSALKLVLKSSPSPENRAIAGELLSKIEKEATAIDTPSELDGWR